MKSRPYLLTIIALIAALAFTTGAVWSAPAPDSFADLALRLKPSVVNISTTTVIKGGRSPMQPPGDGQGNDPFREFFGDEFFKRFFGDQGGGGQNNGQGQREFKTHSLGSGFIWDDKGYIVTNYHVVENAEEIIVLLSDEVKYEAQVVGTDPKTDLALLKIESNGVPLSPVERGDSDVIRVGDWVLAIGNPFGYGHTVTAGIISAKQRVIGSGPYDSFLQTDAAINPGNSGGPLFDTTGQVVGINTAIVSNGTGIGFAIPINRAAQIVAQLKESGVVTRGWLGVVVQTITDDLAKSLGMDKTRGALVSDLAEDGPAEDAGLQRGDVIVTFNDSPVERQNQLPYMVASLPPGTKVTVEVLRKGESLTLDVTLGELPGDDMAKTPPSEKKLGLTVQEVTPEMREHLELDDDLGLVITSVERGSPAAEAGIRKGDLILEINQTTVHDLADYRKAIQEASKSDSVLLLVNRSGNSIYIVVKLPAK